MAASVIVTNKSFDKFLVIKVSYANQTFTQFIKGAKNNEETFEQCAIREGFEES